MELNKVIKYPISTEKAVRLMEINNILTFIVDKKSKKPEIKKAVKQMYNVNVIKITTLIMPNGKKKAYLKLPNETPAIDIATQLGLM